MTPAPAPLGIRRAGRRARPRLAGASVACATALLAAWSGAHTAAAQEWTLVRNDGGPDVTGASIVFPGDDGRVVVQSPAGEPMAAVDLDALGAIRFPEVRAAAADVVGRDLPLVRLRSGAVLPAELAPAAVPPVGGGQVFPFVLEADWRAPGDDGRFDVALPFLAWIRFGALDPVARELVQQAEAEPPEAEDLLFARVGDDLRRLSVRVLGFEPATAGDGGEDQPARVRMEFGGRERELPLDRIGALVFGRARGAAPEPPARPLVATRLPTDPSLLAGPTGRDHALVGHLGRLTPNAVHLALAECPALALRRSMLAAGGLEVLSSRVARLEALDPRSFTRVDALDRSWPWLRNESPAGPGIRLGGRDFGRGYVLRPSSRLVFDLPRGFDGFRATVGIEDRAGPLGDAVVKVLAGKGADPDRVVFEQRIRSGDAPVEIDAALGDAETLALVAEFGERFDLGDHCAFAIPRLTKD